MTVAARKVFRGKEVTFWSPATICLRSSERPENALIGQ